MPCIIAVRDSKFYGCYRTFANFLNAIEDDGFRVLGPTDNIAEYTCRDSRGDPSTFRLVFRPFDGIVAVVVHDDGTVCSAVSLHEYAVLRATNQLVKGHADYLPCVPV